MVEPKGRWRKPAIKILIGVVIVVALISVMLVLGSLSPDLQIEEWDAMGLMGDALFQVKVTNTGNEISSGTITCSVTTLSGTYFKNQTLTLAPGKTITYFINVDLPYGESLSMGTEQVTLSQ